MVAANFPAALKFTLVEEGGNDDDVNDHGGRTSRGIIQREWDAWRAAHADLGLPQDVWQAPQEQIEAIYKAQYWEPFGDRLPGGLDLEFFDTCVNAGRSRAVKTLQKALGVDADGMIGVITWGAIEKTDVAACIHVFSDVRRAFYRALAQFPRYGKGWMARTDRCEVAAQKLVTAVSTMPHGYPVPVPSPKANDKDLRQPPVAPPTGTVVTGGAGGVIAILEQFKDAIQGYTGSVKYVEYALVGIAAVSFALTLYGFWQRNQTQAQVT